jgi:outer membrane lipoprotein-sorting protein
MANLGKAAARKPPKRGWRGRLRRTLGAAVLVLLAGVAASPGFALALPQPFPLTAQDQTDLQRIAVYLNSISTMYARFTQYSANGGIATGQMWMERPGRMRFEYNLPSPILLLADRFYIYYIDKKLATVQQYGLESTPAWLLLRDPISFDDVVVTGFARGPNLLRVTVVEKAHPDKGSLTMEFRDNPLQLRQWTVVDAERRATTVVLGDEEFGMGLSPSLFVYKNPFTGRSYNDSNN